MLKISQKYSRRSRTKHKIIIYFYVKFEVFFMPSMGQDSLEQTEKCLADIGEWDQQMTVETGIKLGSAC